MPAHTTHMSSKPHEEFMTRVFQTLTQTFGRELLCSVAFSLVFGPLTLWPCTNSQPLHPLTPATSKPPASLEEGRESFPTVHWTIQDPLRTHARSDQYSLLPLSYDPQPQTVPTTQPICVSGTFCVLLTPE